MADPRLRGTLSSCILLTYCIGILLVSLIGFNISWKMSAGLGAVIALIDLVGYSLLHESPVWFVRNNRISDARKVYRWLWGSGHHVEVRHTHTLCTSTERETQCRELTSCAHYTNYSYFCSNVYCVDAQHDNTN